MRSTPVHVAGIGEYHSITVTVSIGDIGTMGLATTTVESTTVVSAGVTSTPEAVPVIPSLRILIRFELVTWPDRSTALSTASAAATPSMFRFDGCPSQLR